MRVTRYFSNGTMNKDTDERIVPNGQYIHAENIRVNINESGTGGVVTNIKGTVLLSSISSLNNGVDFTNPVVIGEGRDTDDWCIYVLFKTDEADLLVEYNYKEKTLSRVLQGDLGLDENYLVNELNVIKDSVTGNKYLAWTDNLNPIRFINVSRCKLFSIGGFEEEDICLIKKPPIFEPKIELSYTDTFEENFIEDKFLHFAYRYQYLDGEYSALSPFSLAGFEPKDFYLKYDTMENEGMVNRYNKIDIYFNTGSKRVKSIDLVYRESGNNTIYKIQSYQKSKEGWGDDEEVSIPFFNNKIYSVLPEKELYRLYDNVPLVARDLTVIGNSLVLSNYKQGYDMIDSNHNKVSVDYELKLIQQANKDIVIGFSSDVITFSLDFSNVVFDLGSKISISLSFIETEYELNSLVTASYILKHTAKDFDEFYTQEGVDFVQFLTTEINKQFENNLRWTSVRLPNHSFGYFDHLIGSVLSDRIDNVLKFITPRVVYKVDSFDLEGGELPGGETEPAYAYVTTENFKLFDDGNTTIKLSSLGSFRSLKSNRDYELGLVYVDDFGRQSSTQVCKNNTLFIPISASTSNNKIEVLLKNKPPKWATSYRFVLKSVKESYQNFFSTVFYEEGLYRWLKVEGANKNKIEEGDVIVIKSDKYGLIENLVKTKVLEVKSQPENFISDNELATGNEIKESAGLYIKIKPRGFNLDYGEGTLREFTGGSHTMSPVETYTSPEFSTVIDGVKTPIKIGAGSRIRIYIQFKRNSANLGGVSSFNHEYEKEFDVQESADSFKEWFEKEVTDLGRFGKEYTFHGTNSEGIYGVGYGFNSDGSKFFARSNRGGSGGKSVITTIRIDLFNVDGGSILFETDKKTDTVDLYYETGQTFKIENNLHLGNVQNQSETEDAKILLAIFNCFSYKKGVESYRIKDDFIGNALTTDLRPTTVLNDEYKQEHKFSSLTWSGNYEEETSVNRLNEFNPALANFKKLEDSYGEITRSISKDNNLIVFQNDKVSNLLYGKKALFNQDGTANIGASDLMFGDQIPYTGEYVCSSPESIVKNRNSIFFIDRKRGTPLKLTEAGLNDIYGYYYEGENIRRDMLSNDFISMCREHFDSKFYGSFDAENKEYILTVRSEDYTKTIAYTDRGNGWSCEYSFVSDQLTNLNNRLVGIKDGVFYEHNISSEYNTFYGVSYPSRIVSLFNDYPSDVKVYNAFNIEGNTAWDSISMKTNLTETSIQKDDFRYIEDEWYSVIKRNTKEHINSLSVHGIGEVFSVFSSTIIMKNDIPSGVSIGDKVYINNNETLLGEIISIEGNKLKFTTIDTMPIPNDFLFSKKNTSITGGSMRGYYLQFDMSINSNQKVELYNVNAEISKSNP